MLFFQAGKRLREQVNLDEGQHDQHARQGDNPFSSGFWQIKHSIPHSAQDTERGLSRWQIKKTLSPEILLAVKRSDQHKGQQRHRQRTRQVEQHIGDGPDNAAVLQQIGHF